jgi:hypothetical protein
MTVRPTKLAAAAQALEAVEMCVAGVYAAAATASGKSYDLGDGILVTVMAFIAAAGLAAIAAGINRTKPWSRTPAVMIQVFAVGWSLYLVDGDRFDWAVPTLILAVAVVGGLLAPSSIKALNRSE